MNNFFINIVLIVAIGLTWGASFMFTMIASPVVGPVDLVISRLIIAAVFLAPIFLRKRYFKDFKNHIKPLIIFGIFNCIFRGLTCKYLHNIFESSITNFFRIGKFILLRKMNVCDRKLQFPLGNRGLGLKTQILSQQFSPKTITLWKIHSHIYYLNNFKTKNCVLLSSFSATRIAKNSIAKSLIRKFSG